MLDVVQTGSSEPTAHLSVKDHSKRVGYRIQYKGCFHKKGGLKIKRVGYKHHCQLWCSAHIMHSIL